MASLGLAAEWLNSPAWAGGVPRGHVVLVSFWTYTCINWLRTLPYLRAWAEKYEDLGLVVVGVHTPEFDFEHDLDNVRQAVANMGIAYPVAIDNDYVIWTSFDNHYWPALYFVDAQGQIRHHHLGEGGYEQSERIIQHLLNETGADGINDGLVRPKVTGVEVAGDGGNLWSPENYLGSERTENFASPNGAVLGTRHAYAAPAQLRLNHWAISGDWTITPQAIALNEGGGLIAYCFHARDVNLVMAATMPGGPVRFRVRMDAQLPGAAHGIDVDENGDGVLIEPRLYQLIRQPGAIAEQLCEITFLDPGVQAYVFTFG